MCKRRQEKCMAKKVEQKLHSWVHDPGWVDGWMELETVLRKAYSNQKMSFGSWCLMVVPATNSSLLSPNQFSRT